MRSIVITIAVLGAGLVAHAEQPSVADLNAIKREAARDAGLAKVEVGMPTMIGKNLFTVEVLVGQKKCKPISCSTGYLAPTASRRHSRMASLSNAQPSRRTNKPPNRHLWFEPGN